MAQGGNPDYGDRAKNGACFHDFCKASCYRSKLPSVDPLGPICANVTLCNHFNNKLNEFGRYYGLPIDEERNGLRIDDAIACNIKPSEILGLLQKRKIAGEFAGADKRVMTKKKRPI